MLTLSHFQVIMPILPPETAAEYLPHLNAAMEEFGINTPDRQAAFLAQLAHESRGLTRLEEIPWTEYRCACGWKGRRLARGGSCAKCGQYAGLTTVKYPDCYEGREKLGNTQPGDGVRFKGRGPIQLTGRANYYAASRALFPRGPLLTTYLEAEPDRVLDPEVGFRVAGWFWATRKAKGVHMPEVAPMANAPLHAVADQVGKYLTSGREKYARSAFDSITRAINGGLNGAPQRWAYYLRAREVLGQPQDKEEGRTT